MIKSDAATNRRRALIVVSFAAFVDILLYSLIIPLMPYYAENLGAGETELGILFAVYALALFVAAPFLGKLSDRIGRRKPMIYGLLGLGVGTLLFAHAGSMAELILARALQGIASAANWTAGLALLADSYPRGERGRAMGTVLAGASFGYLAGPPLAGWLYNFGGYLLPFLVATAFVSLDLLARIVLIREPKMQSAAGISLKPLVRSAAGRRLLLLIAGGVAVFSLIEPVLPLLLQERIDATPALTGTVFAVLSIANMIAFPLAGHLAESIPRIHLIRGGLGAMIVLLPVLGLLTELGPTLITAAGFGVAIGIFLAPTLPELAAVAENMQIGYATTYAAYNQAYALGMLLGPLLGGLLVESTSFTIGFNIVSALTAILLLASLRPVRRRKIRFPEE